jgi:hypothetical protein
MSPAHTYGMVTHMNVIRNPGTAVEQEAVIATESAREEVCHIICLVILLLAGTPTTSISHHQDPYMLNATRADAAHVWSLARSSTILMMSGTQIAGHRHNTVASPVRALPLRIALDLLLETIKTLTSDIRRATSLLRRSVKPRIISSRKNLPAVDVLRLTKTRLMHHLANLVSDRHLFLPQLLCLHRKLRTNHHQSHRMAEDLHFLAHRRHLL